jgi:hypothetical protein
MNESGDVFDSERFIPLLERDAGYPAFAGTTVEAVVTDPVERLREACPPASGSRERSCATVNATEYVRRLASRHSNPRRPLVTMAARRVVDSKVVPVQTYECPR